MKRTLLYVLVVFCVITVGIGHAVCADNVPPTKKLQKQWQKQCLSDKNAQACLSLANYYEKSNPQHLGLFYYAAYVNYLPDKDKKFDVIERKIKKFWDSGINADPKEQACLTAVIMPLSLDNGYISTPTNTLDGILLSQIGNFQSLLKSANMGVGVDQSYNFHTLTNAIRLIYTRGTGGQVVALLYYIGQSINPKDPGAGLLEAFRQVAEWNYHPGLLHRKQLPQYGTSLQIVDLMKQNKLTPIAKKIVSALLTGDADAAAKIMFADIDEVNKAIDTWNTVVRRDYCNFPN